MLEFDVVEYLRDSEKKELLSIYYDYYKKVNNLDIFDSFLKVTNGKIQEYIDDKELINKTINAKLTLKALNDLQNSYLLIKNDGIIIGTGRVNMLDNVGYVFEVAFKSDCKEKNDIWKQAISFLEEYFYEKKCSKIFLYIPFNQGSLLYRADELGFKENPDDIKNDDEFYMLSKILES